MKLIRFDWAMKKILQHKANFDILEGFVSELLGEEIKIKQILDSESNKETEDDKYNRVDILVENTNGDLVIIEIQNSKEYDYFQRILFGTSKVITEHIKEGEPFAAVKKVISITIAYFDLGQGQDYIYHGTTSFLGIHQKDVLTLSQKQIELYKKTTIADIYPEYWLIKVEQFSDTIKDKLDEWVYFLKNAEIKDGFSAKGLKEASQRLNAMKLDEQEQKEYNKYLRNLHEIASRNYNNIIDIQDIISRAESRAADKKEMELVMEMHHQGLAIELIASITQKTIESIQKIIQAQNA